MKDGAAEDGRDGEQQVFAEDGGRRNRWSRSRWEDEERAEHGGGGYRRLVVEEGGGRNWRRDKVGMVAVRFLGR